MCAHLHALMSCRIPDANMCTGFFASGQNPKFGFRMNQIKYQLMRKQVRPSRVQCLG
jgi:hypothetical protein